MLSTGMECPVNHIVPLAFMRREIWLSKKLAKCNSKKKIDFYAIFCKFKQKI